MAKTILVVDDDERDRNDMVNILKEAKYSVDSASNGIDALEKVSAKKPDLILLDIKMPTLSGYDLLVLLRERLNGTLKIVYVSILNKNKVDLDKVDGFIQKPYDKRSLLDGVKCVIGGSK
ncbi:MAG: response regulator [Nanoarchaeota archaeon]